MTVLLDTSSRSISSGCSALAATSTTGQAPEEAAAEVLPAPTATMARMMARDGWYPLLLSASGLSTLEILLAKMTAIFPHSLMLSPASQLHQRLRATMTTFFVHRRTALASATAGVPPWVGSTFRPTTIVSATTAVRTVSVSAHGHLSRSHPLVHFHRHLRQPRALDCRQSLLAPPHLLLPRRLHHPQHGLLHRLVERVSYEELQLLPLQQQPKSHSRRNVTLGHAA